MSSYTGLNILSHIDMSKYVSGLTEELRFAYSKGEIAVQVDVPQIEINHRPGDSVRVDHQ